MELRVDDAREEMSRAWVRGDRGGPDIKALSDHSHLGKLGAPCTACLLVPWMRQRAAKIEFLARVGFTRTGLCLRKCGYG